MQVRIIDARTTAAQLPENDMLFVAAQFPGAATYSFFYDSGLTSFVRHHNRRQKPVHGHIFYAEKQAGDVGV